MLDDDVINWGSCGQRMMTGIEDCAVQRKRGAFNIYLCLFVQGTLCVWWDNEGSVFVFVLDMSVFFIDLVSSRVFIIDLPASLPRVPWHRFIDGGFPPRQYQVSQLAGDLHSVQCTPAWSLTTRKFQRRETNWFRNKRGFALSSGWRFQVVGFENKWREILLSTYLWNVASHSLK